MGEILGGSADESPPGEAGTDEPPSSSDNPGSANDSGADDPVSPGVASDRVTAGRGLYTSKACVICHGEDGRMNVGNNITLFNCPSCGTWTQLKERIEASMPPASGNLSPSDCVEACAERTADWIWVEVNGWSLTPDGGTRPPVAAVNLGYDTRRIKSFDSIKADFARVFGTLPSFLEDSEGAFPTVPAYWFREGKLGAVTLNVLVNAAVQGCQSEAMPALESSAVRSKCQDWARRMWLRDATDDELASCVRTAFEITGPLGNARRQLEFACASMMVSLPALTF